MLLFLLSKHIYYSNIQTLFSKEPLCYSMFLLAGTIFFQILTKHQGIRTQIGKWIFNKTAAVELRAIFLEMFIIAFQSERREEGE